MAAFPSFLDSIEDECINLSEFLESSIQNLDYISSDEQNKYSGDRDFLPVDEQNRYSGDRDFLPVCISNYEESTLLFQDKSISNLLENSNSNSSPSSESHFEETSLSFDNYENPPSDFIRSISDWSNCYNYLDVETDIENISKEFEISDKSSEYLNCESSVKISTDFTENSDSIKENISTAKLPTTVILKKFKSVPNKNVDMVAPFNIPKSIYTLVQVPGESTNESLPEKVSVLNINTNYSNSKDNETSNTDKGVSQNKSNLSLISLDKKNMIQDLQEIHVETNIQHKNNSEILNYEDLPFTSLKRKYPSISRPKPAKKKAYELSPLSDPTLERCRKNAINAKKNRETKKQKMMELEEKIFQEREEKLRLASENETLRQMNEKLLERVNFLSSALESSTHPTIQEL